MPARYLFVLPLAINHLWHEVGVYAFQQKYVSPRAELARERFRKVAMTHLAAKTPNSATDDTGAMRPVMTEFTLDLGDFSADAMTLIHGFRADVKAFIISTATALFETPNFKLAPSSVRDAYLTYLLLRLYLALECTFSAMLRHPSTLPTNDDTITTEAQLEAWNPDPALVHTSILGIVSYLNEELLVGHRRYEKYSISESIVRRAVANINETVKEGFRPFLKDIVLSLESYPVDIADVTRDALSKIMTGDVVDLAEIDINDIFRLLQAEMIEELRGVPSGERYSGSFFRPMAALTRSSILSFYKREERPAASHHTGRPTFVE